MATIYHPSHYTRPGRRECIDEMQDEYGRLCIAYFCKGNENKYIYRAGMKVGESYCDDIEKARWYSAKFEKVYNSWSWFQVLVSRLATKICF